MPVDWQVALRMAATLSGRHSAAIGARSLDILHIAAAKAIRATELVTFDSRQRSLAVAAGFSAAP
jgi:predicted nucleic acid-binding protein